MQPSFLFSDEPCGCSRPVHSLDLLHVVQFLWTPHQLVRAQTHIFSRAHITVHNSPIEPHFFNVGTPHWLRVEGICVAHFL